MIRCQIFLAISLFSLLCPCKSRNCSIDYCQSCPIESVCSTCMIGFTNFNSDGTLCLFNDACSQPACSSCFNNTCTMCLLGYSLHSSGVCIKCPSNCIQCTQNGKCLLCNDNFSPQNNVCSENHFPGCVLSLNTYTCLKCQVGLYDNKGICSSCISGCLYCTNSSNCFACDNRFYVSISSQQTTCSLCKLSCHNCFGNSSNCTSCNIDRYLFNNQCVYCYLALPFCITCDLPINSSTPVCLSCSSGMFVSTNGSCSRCPEGCLTCSNATVCSVCQVMLFLNSLNICQPCGIDNCLSCQNNQTCLSCQTTFTLVTQQANTFCAACPSNCKKCLQKNQCITCLSYYYLNVKTKLCSPCLPNCAICLSPFTCQGLQTSSNFFLLHFNSYPLLILCPDECPNCQDQNGIICLTCPPGYYLDEICELCPVSNCFNCNGTLFTHSCVLCFSGYYLTQQGQCIQCSQGCGICQNNFSCQVCADGYFYQNQQCISCSSDCQSCNSTECFLCSMGFFLSSQLQSQSLSQCQKCPIGCQICVTQNICKLCSSGYFFVPPSPTLPLLSMCSPCVKPCSICSSNNTCVICERGFKLNSFGQCASCPGNFAVCERGYEFQCLDRFTLAFDVFELNNNEASYKCLPCPNGCGKCKYHHKNSSLFCVSCLLGFETTITGECFQCGTTNSTAGCLSCSSSGSCASCLSGFILHNGKCINASSESDSSWPLIGANIALGCLSMILIISILVQRNQTPSKPSNVSIQLANEK